MLSTQEMLRLLASAVEGTDLEDKHLSVQDLVSALASCVDVDEDGFYLRVNSDGASDDRRTEEEEEKEPVKEIYQMVETQVWVDHERLRAQQVNENTVTPTELKSDNMSILLTENRTGAVGEYMLRYDDSVLYYDPANSGKNTDKECRIFKDVAEFMSSDVEHGAIYINASFFGEKFLAKWYVTKTDERWYIPDVSQYDVLRTYTKLN